MQYTEEHAYGHQVLLWAAGECLVGFLESSEGLAGDTPMGLLENVRYDRKTGKLAFSARLSLGRELSAGAKETQRSRDLFTFEGTLKKDQLAGVLTHAWPNDPKMVPVREEVVLRIQDPVESSQGAPGSYGAWQKEWAPALKSRGPGW